MGIVPLNSLTLMGHGLLETGGYLYCRIVALPLTAGGKLG